MNTENTDLLSCWSREFFHRPALVTEVLAIFAPLFGENPSNGEDGKNHSSDDIHDIHGSDGSDDKKSPVWIVDATLGGGGHSAALLQQFPSCRALGIDKDKQSIRAAGSRLAPFGERVRLVQSDFRNMTRVVAEQGLSSVHGILLDLGVSSPQLDWADRGFSFRQEAPIDMRMDTCSPLRGSDVVNEYDFAELERVIREYGEERFARRIARSIVRHREHTPILTTTALGEIVKDAIPAATRRTGPHPARRTFQAIRIEVNDELGALQDVLHRGFALLAPGGRMAVISYHSLEDRAVKRFFLSKCRPAEHPRGMPVEDLVPPAMRCLTRKPVCPSAEETEKNPRVVSAKLRAGEKV